MDEPNAASVALIRAGQVLLIERAFEPFKGDWTLPGGRREPGETIEGCAIREIGEELRLAIAELQPVMTMEISPRFRLAVFATARFTGEIVASAEIAAWAWVRPETIGMLRTTPDLDVALRRAFSLYELG